MIAALHIPYFATTLYAHDHALPLSHPLALVADETLYALNQASEQGGLRRHMPEREARARFPDAHFLPAQPLRDAEVLALITDCVHEHTDKVDPINSPQMPHILMEMPVRQRRDQVAVAQTLGRTVRDLTSLTPTCGIAPAIFTARTAAATTPPGNVRYIPLGREPALLAPLPVALLPLERDTLARLHRFGITTIGQFAALPAGSVLNQFGRSGKAAHEIAQGRDPARLKPRLPPLTFEQSHTFEDAVTYRQPLEAVLNQISAKLSNALRLRRVSTSLVRLTLFTEEGTGYERKAPLRDPLQESAALDAVLARLLNLIPITSGVVELTVSVEGLGSPIVGVRQLGFLDRLYAKGTLERFFPRLLERYGPSSFWRVVFRAEPEGYPPEAQFDLVPF